MCTEPKTHRSSVRLRARASSGARAAASAAVRPLSNNLGHVRQQCTCWRVHGSCLPRSVAAHNTPNRTSMWIRGCMQCMTAAHASTQQRGTNIKRHDIASMQRNTTHAFGAVFAVNQIISPDGCLDHMVRHAVPSLEIDLLRSIGHKGKAVLHHGRSCGPECQQGRSAMSFSWNQRRSFATVCRRELMHDKEHTCFCFCCSTASASDHGRRH